MFGNVGLSFTLVKHSAQHHPLFLLLLFNYNKLYMISFVFVFNEPHLIYARALDKANVGLSLTLIKHSSQHHPNFFCSLPVVENNKGPRHELNAQQIALLPRGIRAIQNPKQEG
jgi:hypothetical protein